MTVESLSEEELHRIEQEAAALWVAEDGAWRPATAVRALAREDIPRLVAEVRHLRSLVGVPVGPPLCACVVTTADGRVTVEACEDHRREWGTVRITTYREREQREDEQET